MAGRPAEPGRGGYLAAVAGPGGRGQWIAASLVAIFMLFSLILPFLALLYASFLPYLQAPSPAAFRAMSMVNYDLIFSEPFIGAVMWKMSTRFPSPKKVGAAMLKKT